MKKINIVGHCDGFRGYGRLGGYVALGLKKLGYSVSYYPLTLANDFGSTLLPGIGDMITTVLGDADLNILFHPVNVDTEKKHLLKGKNNILFTMWETDQVPPQAEGIVDGHRLVVVPTEFSKQAFLNAGILANYRVCPLGIDPATFYPEHSIPPITTFGSCGRLGHGKHRKGMERLVEIFQKAFPIEENVCLRIKIFPDCPFPDRIFDSRVQVIRAYFPDDAMRQWYQGLSAYVNNSTGEGFGLHPLEAMACGRPVIQTLFSGHSVYSTIDSIYKVSHSFITPQDAIYQSVGRMGLPDAESMIIAMRDVYNCSAKALIKGYEASKVAKRFSIDNMVNRLDNIIQEVI